MMMIIDVIHKTKVATTKGYTVWKYIQHQMPCLIDVFHLRLLVPQVYAKACANYLCNKVINWWTCNFVKVISIQRLRNLQNLDKYSVTMDKFGGSVTAPIKRTMFGCRRHFIMATWKSKINWSYRVINYLQVEPTE